MITVKPINQTYGVEFKTEDGVVVAHIRQLKYAIRNKIQAQVTNLEGGKVTFDNGLHAFLNIKYSLRKLEGVFNEDGTPFVLEFDILDDAVDALLSTDLEDNILYTARLMGSRIPKEITNPFSGIKLEGVEVIEPKNLGGIEKK